MTRDRGTYGPIDRDQHFVAGWGADKIVAHAHDRTIGAALRTVMPAVDLASRAQRAGERLWVGTRLMGGRGEAEKPLPVVGQELFHSAADRVRAIAMLSTGFQALANDLAVWQEANMSAPGASALAQWMSADVTPILEEWNSFATGGTGSWWRKVVIPWSTFENWMLRLRQLRSFARAHGVALQSSEPVPLPKTLWQRNEEGKGSDAAAFLGVLKIGAAAVLTVAGTIGVYRILRDIRSNREHVDPEARKTGASPHGA